MNNIYLHISIICQWYIYIIHIYSTCFSGHISLVRWSYPLEDLGPAPDATVFGDTTWSKGICCNYKSNTYCFLILFHSQTQCIYLDQYICISNHIIYISEIFFGSDFLCVKRQWIYRYFFRIFLFRVENPPVEPQGVRHLLQHSDHGQLCHEACPVWETTHLFETKNLSGERVVQWQSSTRQPARWGGTKKHT